MDSLSFHQYARAASIDGRLAGETTRVIIRLLRGSLPSERSRLLLERLRALPAEVAPPGGLLSFTYGFRNEPDHLSFLAISSWREYSDIADADGGTSLTRPQARLGDLLDEAQVEHYELVDDSPGLPVLDGAVLGLVWGRVAPNAEGAAHDMVRHVRDEITRAGVLALHVGRRVVENQSEIVVVALWSSRIALHTFAKGRASGTINPEFLKLMTHWRFETYDCVGPDRFLVPGSGPAVLLADDDGRYVDASPGVEALLGVPGEFILHGQLEDVTPEGSRAEIQLAWRSFLEAGHQEGMLELRRHDGTRLTVKFRAEANCPHPGLHASLLSLPADDALDGRPLEQVVAEAFGGVELARGPVPLQTTA
jgi:PAS domain-containing protein